MTEQKNIITVDGVEHNVEDMSTEQQYFVAQLRSISGKVQTLQFDLDQVQASQSAFTKTLTDSLAEPEVAEEQCYRKLDQSGGNGGY